MVDSTVVEVGTFGLGFICLGIPRRNTPKEYPVPCRHMFLRLLDIYPYHVSLILGKAEEVLVCM